MIIPKTELIEKHFRDVEQEDLEKTRLYIQHNLIKAAKKGQGSVAIVLPKQLVFRTGYSIDGLSVREIAAGRKVIYSNSMGKFTMESLANQMLAELKEAGYDVFLIEDSKTFETRLLVTFMEEK